jgi:uncharacterized membrane protein
VTHSILPVRDLLASVQTFDPHPPLYYLQLHGWLWFGQSDFWIRLNSVVWSVLAALSLYLTSRVIFTVRVARWAALTFALSPLAIGEAQEARMYALLMFLGIWGWFFTHQLLAGRNKIWMVGGLVAASLAFLYSHGAGFMGLVSTSVYAFTYWLNDWRGRVKNFAWWLVAQIVIVVAYLPWLQRAQSITVGHTVIPSAANVARTVTILWLGFGRPMPSALDWGVLLLTGVLCVALAFDRERRSLALAFIVAPLVFCAVVSYLYRPIWLYRTLAYLAPFLCLALALGCAALRSRPWLARGAMLVVCWSLAGALANQYLTFTYPVIPRAAAEWVRSTARLPDVIYVPNERVFWGWGWYFAGPGSVNPLTTTYALTTHDGLLVFARSALPPLEAARVYWVVYRFIDDPAPFSASRTDLVHEARYELGGLIIEKIHLATP